MNTRALIAATIALASLWCAAQVTHAKSSETGGLFSSDEKLLSAIEENDVPAMKILLANGADPDASNGKSRYGHALCLASESGREAALRVLIENGADVDRLYGGDQWYGSPLACAITNDSFAAFEILIDARATPDLDVCLYCDYEWNIGPVEIGVDSLRYRMIWRLVELGAVHPRARESIIFSLENFPLSEPYAADPYRIKIIRWLEEQGIELDLREPIPEHLLSR